VTLCEAFFRLFSLRLYDGIVDCAPVFVFGVEHDVDQDGHEHGEHVAAVEDLGAIDLALPSGAAVHELVSQDVEAVEDFGKEQRDALVGKIFERIGFVFFKALEPLGIAAVLGESALAFPEGLEDVAVFDQGFDGAGEFFPEQIVDAAGGVVLDQFFDEGAERFAFAEFFVGVFAVGIAGVEGDPEADESQVDVIGLFGGAA